MAKVTERIAFCSLTNERLQKYGHLNAPAIALLVYLGTKDQVDVETLSQLTQLDEVIINTFLSDLEADGLATHMSPWRLTDKGRQLAKELTAEILEVNRRISEEPALEKTFTNNSLISFSIDVQVIR